MTALVLALAAELQHPRRQQQAAAQALGLVWLSSFIAFILGMFLTGFVANWLMMQQQKL